MKALKNSKTKPIVLLSGPVGAGKSTVAKELVALTPGSVSYIEGDTFWSFIARSKSAPKGGSGNFKVIMLSMMAAALPFARAGYEVILDFSLPPWFLDTALKIAALREVPIDYIVLRPSLDVCMQRASTRQDGVITDYEPYKEFYDTFNDAGNYLVSNDENDAVTLATQIRAGLDAGKFRVTQ